MTDLACCGERLVRKSSTMMPVVLNSCSVLYHLQFIWNLFDVECHDLKHDSRSLEIVSFDKLHRSFISSSSVNYLWPYLVLLFYYCIIVFYIIVLLFVFGDKVRYWSKIMIFSYPVYRVRQNKHKCVSKTDTNPPYAFQIAFPRGTDFTGFLQEESKIRDLQSEIYVRIESWIESADSRLQLQC